MILSSLYEILVNWKSYFFFEKIGSDFRVPVLAVAVGIYLPITLTVPIFIGGMVNHFGKTSGAGDAEEKKGLLMSSGFIIVGSDIY